MERKFAQKVVDQLNDTNGPTLSLFEAMAMRKVVTDGYTVYALQKGDVTFLAWIKEDGNVATKIVCW